MRLQLSITVEFCGRPEMPVYTSFVPASDSVSATFGTVGAVVMQMLRVTHSADAVLRYYIGPSLLATVNFWADAASEQMLASC